MEYNGTIRFDTEVDISNFKKAIAKMQNVVNKANVFGALESGIDRFTRKLEGIQPNTSGLSKFGETIGTIGNIMSVTEGIINGVSGAVSAISGSLSTVPDVASVAGSSIGAFGAVASAAVGVIGILSVAIGEYIDTFVILPEATQKAQTELIGLIAMQETLRASVNNSAIAHEMAMTAIHGNYVKGLMLINMLQSLVDENGRVVGSFERTERIIGEINSLLPNLNLQIDIETNALSEGEKEIISYNEALYEMNMLLALRNRDSELLNQASLVGAALLEAQAEIESIHASFLNNDGMLVPEKMANIAILEGRIEALKKVLSMLNTSAEANSAAMKEYESKISATELNRFNALSGEVDEHGRDLLQLAGIYGMTTDEILADMQAQELSIAEWSAKTAESFTDEGKSLEQVARQWGMTTTEVKARMDEWHLNLEQFEAEMEESHTREGLSLQQVATQWGMTADEVKTYMDEWGLNLEEFETEMEETHTREGLSLQQLADKWGATTGQISQWMQINGTDMQGWDDMMNTHLVSVANGFSGLSESAAVTMQEFIANVTERTAAALNANNNILALAAAGVDSSVIDEIISQGEAGYATLQSWVDQLEGLNLGESLFGDTTAEVQTQVDELNGAITESIGSIDERVIRDAILAKFGQNDGDFSAAITGMFGEDIGAQILSEFETNGGEQIGAAVDAIIRQVYGDNAQAILDSLNSNGFDLMGALSTFIADTYGEFAPGIIEQLEASEGDVDEAVARFVLATFPDDYREIMNEFRRNGGDLGAAMPEGFVEGVELTPEQETQASTTISNYPAQVTGGATGEGEGTEEGGKSTAFQQGHGIGQEVVEGMKTSLAEADLSGMAETLQTAVEINAEAFTEVGKLAGTYVLDGFNESISGGAQRGAPQGEGGGAQGPGVIVDTMLDDMLAAMQNDEKIELLETGAKGIADAIIEKLQAMIDGGQEETAGRAGELGGGVGAVNDMMDGMLTAMQDEEKNMLLTDEAKDIADGIVDKLGIMVDGKEGDSKDKNSELGAIGAANYMMDGMLTAMQDKAELLYTKAKTIADTISAKLKIAWDEHSPSKVSYKIMDNYMQGMYNAMREKSGQLYYTIDDIAEGMSDRVRIMMQLTPELIEMVRRPIEALGSGASLMGTYRIMMETGGMDGRGSANGVQYNNHTSNTNLTQNITSPKPLSPSEMTRQAQDLLRRSKWQLP